MVYNTLFEKLGNDFTVQILRTDIKKQTINAYAVNIYVPLIVGLQCFWRAHSKLRKKSGKCKPVLWSCIILMQLQLSQLNYAVPAPQNWYKQSVYEQVCWTWTYTLPKAMGDFIVNNEKKKHSSYGMKSFIP
jgi:hypothetical protein